MDLLIDKVQINVSLYLCKYYAHRLKINAQINDSDQKSTYFLKAYNKCGTLNRICFYSRGVKEATAKIALTQYYIFFTYLYLSPLVD